MGNAGNFGQVTGEEASLFHAASALPFEQRSGFLDQACGKDSPVRARIELLLAHHDQAGILDSSIFAGESLDDHPLLSEGQILAGRFRIVRLIGTGGMGAVYEAEDLVSGLRVALKTIRCDGPERARLNARLRKELRIARTVSHPNVCKVFEYWETDLAPSDRLTFFTMELLQGRTLAQRIAEEGPLGESQALGILRDVASGLTEMHRAGIVHRDLKPANIFLVSREGGERAVILDFGLAHDFSDGATQTRIVMGTPSYMAPEQFQAGKASIATDVYAFGVVAFEMVTGVNHPLVAPRALARGLRPSWDKALLRCFARNPEERPASPQEVIDGLLERSFPVKRAVWVAAAVLAGAIAVSVSRGAWNYFRPQEASRAAVAESIRRKLNPRDQQEYIWVSGQRGFRIGCQGDPECLDEDLDSLPPSPVDVAGFWMGKTEVTVHAFQLVTHNLPPAEPIAWKSYNLNPGWKAMQKPVVMVTWPEAAGYCEAVGGRLPTEAEWEYAARAGSAGQPAYSELLKIAWFADDSGNVAFDGQQFMEDLYRRVPPKSDINLFVYPRWVGHLRDIKAGLHDVAQKQPNAFGLHDLLGNAWEWVASVPTTTGVLPARVFARGGSWDDERLHIRASRREAADPKSRNDDYGFRCVLRNIPEY